MFFFNFRMRTYKRKTTRSYISSQQLKNAVKAVMNEDKSLNASTKEFGIKWMTLTRFIKN